MLVETEGGMDDGIKLLVGVNGKARGKDIDSEEAYVDNIRERIQRSVEEVQVRISHTNDEYCMFPIFTKFINSHYLRSINVFSLIYDFFLPLF